MKRIIIILLALMLLVGCAKTEKIELESTSGSRFVTVEKHLPWRIVVDRETHVMYAVSYGDNNRGTFTLLVDAEGKPLIWKGGNDD